MYIRKIAAAATFATGAALAFAPLAAADPSDFAVSTLDSEIASQNSMLEFAALFTGNTADITHATVPGVYDTIASTAVPQVTDPSDVTALEYYLYGVNPIEAGISSDTGPYSELNGALTQFYNAYNVEAYSLVNGGTLDANPADYIQNSALDHALGLGNTSDAASYLFNFGLGDLQGYFGDFGTPDAGAAVPAAADLSSTLSSEISSLNSIFESDAAFASIPATDIIHATGAFDTISPDNLNETFSSLVFGLNPANISADPGAYDVFNGALTEFYDAYNVGLGALLNGGDLIGVDDLFGSASTIAAALGTDSVSGAIGEFLQVGFNDLLGYFDPSALLGAL